MKGRNEVSNWAVLTILLQNIIKASSAISTVDPTIILFSPWLMRTAFFLQQVYFAEPAALSGELVVQKVANGKAKGEVTRHIVKNRFDQRSP